MMNHYAAYGFWAPAVGNYAVQHKVMDRWDAPRMAELNRIEDPYCYLDRLALPKYVVNAAGDQYFTPDSSKFYFDDLKGPKYLRYVPNGDHSLRGTDAADGILAFYRAANRQPIAHLFPTADRSLFLESGRPLIAPLSVGSACLRLAKGSLALLR
jgi:PhoPQ-activated pathogenicity-related protein